MQNQTNTIPKIALQSVAAGLLLMALFTTMWAGIASGGLTGIAYWTVLVVFAVFAVVFVVNAVNFFRTSKTFAPLVSDEDKAEGKKLGIWYGIIFGAEGLTIPLVCGALIYFHHPQLVIPGIALVVGLHFYPMAKVFKRTIDYYLATWTTLIAITAIIFTINNTWPQAAIFAFLGMGVAIATTSYGLYMIKTGRDWIRS